jgi:hypothetical protein
MAKDIWQCNARNNTLAQAASRFAHTYWDKPRKVIKLKADPNDVRYAATFKIAKIVDDRQLEGSTIYRIYFVEDAIVVERD